MDDAARIAVLECKVEQQSDIGRRLPVLEYKVEQQSDIGERLARLERFKYAAATVVAVVMGLGVWGVVWLYGVKGQAEAAKEAADHAKVAAESAAAAAERARLSSNSVLAQAEVSEEFKLKLGTESERQFNAFAVQLETERNRACYVPIGTIVAFAASRRPGVGWLPCDGSAFLKEEYKELSDVLPPAWTKQAEDALQSEYDVRTKRMKQTDFPLPSRVNPATHFRVPDLRCASLVGAGTVLSGFAFKNEWDVGTRVSNNGKILDPTAAGGSPIDENPRTCAVLWYVRAK